MREIGYRGCNVQKARVDAQSSGVRNFILFKLDLFGTIKNDLQSDVFECSCRIVRSVAVPPWDKASFRR